MSSPTTRKKSTVPALRARKRRRGDDPIVMVTAYDAPSARIVDAAGVDILLVGDSLANVVLGFNDTLHVTITDMAHHTGAVSRAKPECLVVADMPWLSYHVSIKDSITHAAMLIRAGADSVKLEGGEKRKDVVEALISAEIPVMGHLGLTPQSVLTMGGYRVQAKEIDAAKRLIDEAHVLVDAGIWSLVLEGVPDLVAERVTESVEVPTIGIGAGASCDGQVLVFHDILGFSDRKPPKFVRRYANLEQLATEAVSCYVADVKGGLFPKDTETYHASEELKASLG